MTRLLDACRTVWLSPRRTYHAWQAQSQNRSTPIALAFFGVFYFIQLGQAGFWGSPGFFGAKDLLLGSLVVGPFLGFAIIDLFAIVGLGLGRLLGARSTFSNVRSAYALALLPSLICAVLTISVGALAFGSHYFRTNELPPAMQNATGPMLADFAMALITLVALIWSAVTLVATLSEALRTGIWRTIGVIAITSIPWIAIAVVNLISNVGIRAWTFVFMALMFCTFAVLVLVLLVFLPDVLFRQSRFPAWLVRIVNRVNQDNDSTLERADSIYSTLNRFVLFSFSVKLALMTTIVLVSAGTIRAMVLDAVTKRRMAMQR